MGDLFEYKLKEPVTIRKNQSALVPILNSEVQADKVSLWNASVRRVARAARGLADQCDRVDARRRQFLNH